MSVKTLTLSTRVRKNTSDQRALNQTKKLLEQQCINYIPTIVQYYSQDANNMNTVPTEVNQGYLTEMSILFQLFDHTDRVNNTVCC